MQVVPLPVGVASRAWDEQHADCSAAAGQVGGAPTSGFTEGVAGTASRFASTWQHHTRGLADQAEARADGLRTAIADFLETDEAVGFQVAGLRSFLVERR